METVTLSPNGQLPNPMEDVRIVIDPSEELGFDGAELTFNSPIEPIAVLVANTYMMHSENPRSVIVVGGHTGENQGMPAFEIVALDTSTRPRALHVRFIKQTG